MTLNLFNLVRAATPDDAPDIAEIVNRVIRETAITFTTIEKRPEEIAAAIAAAPGRYLVAEVPGEVLGYASFAPFRTGPGYAHTMEHSIALKPGGQGRGTGRALMAALEARAGAEGVHSLIAGVSAENPQGVAFHLALGFRQVAVLPEVGFKFGRWMDLVLLQKFL